VDAVVKCEKTKIGYCEEGNAATKLNEHKEASLEIMFECRRVVGKRIMDIILLAGVIEEREMIRLYHQRKEITEIKRGRCYTTKVEYWRKFTMGRLVLGLGGASVRTGLGGG
jgi:hypothetical protein